MRRNTYPLSLRGSDATAAIRSLPPPSLRSRISGCGNPFLLFKRIKSFCARAARAPYFCTDRNREKNRRTPYGLGFRTFPNDQRDKLPFGNPYYIEIRYVPINITSGKSLSTSRHCEGAGVRWTPLRSRSTDRAGRRDAMRPRQSAPL